MSMKPFNRLTLIVTILGLLALPAAGNAVTINAADVTGLRTFNGGASVILLTFTAVKNQPFGSSLEDRSIVHFDISSLSGTVPLTRLKIPLSNIDPGAPDGTFDVYSFTGDGVVSTDEWGSGTLVSSLTGLQGGIQNLFFDVTPQLQSAVNLAAPFLSFNLRAAVGGDRYNLNVGGFPDPVLEVGVTAIPEPASLLLLGIGSAGLLRRLRKQAWSA